MNCLVLTNFIQPKFDWLTFSPININGVSLDMNEIISKLIFNAKFWVQDWPIFTDEFHFNEAIKQAKTAWLENRNNSNGE